MSESIVHFLKKIIIFFKPLPTYLPCPYIGAS